MRDMLRGEPSNYLVSPSASDSSTSDRYPWRRLQHAELQGPFALPLLQEVSQSECQVSSLFARLATGPQEYDPCW
jgi:hypothetical protein